MMRRARLLLPAAWMALLWILSSIPSHAEGTFVGLVIPAVVQNGTHVIAYAVLAACWFWALGTQGDTVPRLVAGLSLAYGVIDELHQAFVPGRTSSVIDLLLDALGIACVIWAVRTFRRPQAAAMLTGTPLSR